ncbi:MAG: 50S ribosomal protein L13 [Candidatus ainarchaeum sp.]|nr:50S ribosomal protein L13 [Candidatus ainarchaeum sp.]
MKVVDGENLILGRAASGVAKLLLNGEEVAVVNADKMVISGRMPYLLEKYRHRRDMKNKANPDNSPKWPRRPDLFVRRIIRGMLPFDKPRGRAAFKRLSVFPDVPGEVKAAERVTLPGANAEKLETGYHTVAALCRGLGFNY